MFEIILVGLGEVSETHVKAIEQFEGAVIVAGVDIDPQKSLEFRSQDLPVYTSSAEAIREHDPDTVIIATPTPTHFEVCQEVFQSAQKPLKILVEKPGADTLPRTKSLLYDTPDNVDLEVMHHYAYSPEVLWVAKNIPQWVKTLGEMLTYEACFQDPRSGCENARKRQSLSSSWLDLGINALSSAQTMINIASAESVALDIEDEMTANMNFRLSRIVGKMSTQWSVEKPSYDTQIGFESGARLSIDHFNVTATLTDQDQEIGHFPSPDIPRRLSHYLNMYRDIFAFRQMKLDRKTTSKLYELLFK